MSKIVLFDYIREQSFFLLQDAINRRMIDSRWQPFGPTIISPEESSVNINKYVQAMVVYDE